MARDTFDDAVRKMFRVANEMDGIRWIRSYVSEGEGKIYCEFDAPGPESIREHARRAGLPADKISLVTMEINPAMYQ
jgi:hypothetical protein